MRNWTLVSKATGKPIQEGDEVDYRNQSARVSALDPRGSWVWIMRENDDEPHAVWPTQIAAEYKELAKA
jgi:hypothetical protein